MKIIFWKKESCKKTFFAGTLNHESWGVPDKNMFIKNTPFSKSTNTYFQNTTGQRANTLMLGLYVRVRQHKVMFAHAWFRFDIFFRDVAMLRRRWQSVIRRQSQYNRHPNRDVETLVTAIPMNLWSKVLSTIWQI